MTPDAATWAKELYEAWFLAAKMRPQTWDQVRPDVQKGWLAVANRALTLHAQAVEGLKHTLELWDRECDGKSPRELVEAAVARETDRCIDIGKWWVPEDQHGTFADELRARGPQGGANG